MKVSKPFRRGLLTLSFTLIFLGLFTALGDTLTSILTAAFGPACTYENAVENLSLACPAGWKMAESPTEDGYWVAWGDPLSQSAPSARLPHPDRGAKIELQISHFVPKNGIQAELQDGAALAEQVLSSGNLTVGSAHAFFHETISRPDPDRLARTKTVSFTYGHYWYIATLAIFNYSAVRTEETATYLLEFDRLVASIELGPPAGPGALAAPHFVALPAAKQLTVQQGWAYTDDDPTNPTHLSIDYVDGPLDTPASNFDVTAAAGGAATYTIGDSWNGGLGRYVNIRHTVSGQTYYTTYAHLSSSPLPPGVDTNVSIGQKIGVAGSTGYVVPPGFTHLHFELEDANGANFDPYDIYNIRDYYPTPCGADYYWTICPPSYYPGTDTVGWFRQSDHHWQLRNALSPGSCGEPDGKTVCFDFGPEGQTLTPITGDWDGDGQVTVGWFRQSDHHWHLRNALSPGSCGAPDGKTVCFDFGPEGQTLIPITGDWDGDGQDTVGWFRQSDHHWQLRNALSPGSCGAPDGKTVCFDFGPEQQTLTPITGDWDSQ